MKWTIRSSWKKGEFYFGLDRPVNRGRSGFLTKTVDEFRSRTNRLNTSSLHDVNDKSARFSKLNVKSDLKFFFTGPH